MSHNVSINVLHFTYPPDNHLMVSNSMSNIVGQTLTFTSPLQCGLNGVWGQQGKQKSLNT